MHTVCSDGQLAPSALIEQAIHLGLKAFAITDHHTMAGYHQAKRHMEDWQWRNPARVRGGSRRQADAYPLPHLWTGVEITAKLANTDVHILGYAFAPNHMVLSSPTSRAVRLAVSGKQPQAVIAAIQAAGWISDIWPIPPDIGDRRKSWCRPQ
jgi:predicted metal-dependent phosphoesterase TrpH